MLGKPTPRRRRAVSSPVPSGGGRHVGFVLSLLMRRPSVGKEKDEFEEENDVGRSSSDSDVQGRSGGGYVVQ